MNRKRLAIISSRDDLCGNAAYSEALRKNLSLYYHVEILNLDVDLLRNGTKKNVEQFMQDILLKIKNFDFVNIQFEAGLFGCLPKDIISRFYRIAQSAHKLTVTLHRVDLPDRLFSQIILANLFHGRFFAAFRALTDNYKKYRMGKMTVRIIELCIRLMAPIIVHTIKDRKRIEFLSDGKALVFDHPLCYLNQHEKSHYAQQINKENFLTRYGLPSDCVTLGVFGFISAYKGIDTVIKAVKFLPKNYHVLIFGGQHPMDIVSQPHGNAHLLSYVDTVATVPSRRLRSRNNILKNRVHFLGSIYEHDQFVRQMAHCDVIILPYHEVGQGGSGIVALALDLGKNIICSQTRAFLELKKYAEDAIVLCSIGNYLELSEKIKNSQTDHEAIRVYQNKFSGETNAIFYSRLIEGKFDLLVKDNSGSAS